MLELICDGLSKMNIPILESGQYSGLLGQASTGIVLNEDGSFLIDGKSVKFFIFKDLAEARAFAHSLVDSSVDREFSIWDERGALAERIISPVSVSMTLKKRTPWWRFWS